MNKNKTEGTFYLEGLLEGPLPGGNEVESGLIEWSDATRQVGLPFSTEIETGRFSVLADPVVMPAQAFSPSPQESIRLALQRLLEIFPQEYYGRIVSTVRIYEYLPGKEVQGLFVVTPDGGIDYQHRSVDCQTQKPSEPMSPRDLVKISAFTLVVLIAFIGLSTLFIDYGAIWADLRQKFTPVTLDNTGITFGPFSEFYVIKTAAYAPSSREMILEVLPSPNYPKSTEDIDKRWREAKSLSESLTMQAMAKGYAMCEFYDEKGKYVGARIIKLPEMSDKMEIRIPFPEKLKPTVIKLTWPA